MLQRIKCGDRESFKKLHGMTYNHLAVVATNYTYHREDVQDVLNEAYFRVFRYIDSYDGRRDGYNWMCRIVQNVAYAYNKKHGSEGTNRIMSRSLFYELDERITENTALLQAIKLLGGEAQELIYLKYWEDRSLSEIAALKGMKKSTVHKKIAAAINFIRKFLQGE